MPTRANGERVRRRWRDRAPDVISPLLGVGIPEVNSERPPT
jgi:hypothetical protein